MARTIHLIRSERPWGNAQELVAHENPHYAEQHRRMIIMDMWRQSGLTHEDVEFAYDSPKFSGAFERALEILQKIHGAAHCYAEIVELELSDKHFGFA